MFKPGDIVVYNYKPEDTDEITDIYLGEILEVCNSRYEISWYCAYSTKTIDIGWRGNCSYNKDFAHENFILKTTPKLDDYL